MKINIVADQFGSTGYNIHSRNLTVALSKIAEIGVESSLPVNWQFECPDEILKAMNNNFRNEATLMITLPFAWNMKLSDRPKKFAGYLVFEGDKIPTDWVRIANQENVDYVIVPSEHTKKACIGIDSNKIKVVNHGVNREIFKPVAPMPELKSDKFTFLFIGGWAQGDNDRKNFSFLARAFAEEFKADENVRLLAKINPVYNNPMWNLNEEMKKLNLKENHAEIKITDALLPETKLPSVYACGDVFVCPTKAEAFGMVFLEAMACGLPCIAGGYGGQTDFINDRNGYLLKRFKLKKATDPNPIYEETNWAEYQIDDLRKLLRHCFENQDEVSKKGFQAFNDSVSYGWNNTAKGILECIKN